MRYAQLVQDGRKMGAVSVGSADGDGYIGQRRKLETELRQGDTGAAEVDPVGHGPETRDDVGHLQPIESSDVDPYEPSRSRRNRGHRAGEVVRTVVGERNRLPARVGPEVNDVGALADRVERQVKGSLVSVDDLVERERGDDGIVADGRAGPAGVRGDRR